MKSTQELYIDVLKEEITPNEFLFQVRKDPRFKQWITPLQSYNDTIQTLKDKGAINESFIDSEGNELDPEDEDSFLGKKWSKNPSWDAMNRLDKGEGDDDDEAVVTTYSGVGNSALHPRHAFSVNEDLNNYKAAFNSIIEKLQQGNGNDAEDVDQLIDIATVEFDLNDDERKTLDVDVFDWRNQESGTEYNDEETWGRGDELEEDAGMPVFPETDPWKEDELSGGLGDTTDSNTLNRKELEIGINTEMEHTNDPVKAKEIATDHLTEDPQYYSKLNKAHLQEQTRAPHVLDVKKEFPEFDNIRFNQLLRGARYEYELAGKRNWSKCYEKAGKNLLKDPLYYVHKFNNLKPNKKRTDKEIPVKGASMNDKKNGMVPAPKKESKQSRLKKGSTFTQPKKQKVTTMTQKPSSAKGVAKMKVPGKEKKVKLSESKLNLIASIIKEEVENLLKKKVNEVNGPAYKGPQGYDDSTDSYQDKDSQIQYILQHKNCIKQQEQCTPEWLESQSNLYINKLYDAVCEKVQQNKDLGDQEPEFSQLGEMVLSKNYSHELVQNLWNQAVSRLENKAFNIAEKSGFDFSKNNFEIAFNDVYEQIKNLPLNSNKLLSLYKNLKNNIYGLSLNEDQEDLLTEDEVKLQEVKGLEIKPGLNFTIQGDLGKFKQGEKVNVIAVNNFSNEIQFTLRNDQGTEDTFIMDINDKFDA